ncbi:Carbon catabolite repressor protein 4 homolog 5 [Linum perenne]
MRGGRRLQASMKEQPFIKCIRSDNAEQRPHKRRSKKRKILSDPQTLTRNQFQPIISPSSSANFGRKPKRIRKSSTSEDNRQWIFSFHDPTAFRDKVVVVSYNILGVENALKHPDLYTGVPREFLKWDRRKQLICKEIKQYDAGILCFQEVDRFSDLDNLLQKDGFRGIYKARTGEACDGCALFWKDKIFTLLHEECIEFRNFGLRDNVAQLCILKINDHQSETDTEIQIPEISARKNRSFVVANIHVLFNPNRGDIKLGQVRLLLQKAYQLSEEWGSIPVIIGGDLNSIPESAMYQFLSSSELDILEHDRRKISGQLGRPAQQKHLRFQIEHVSRGAAEQVTLVENH